MWSARDDRLFIPIAIILVVLAWLALLLWGQSPHARYLSHDGLEEIGGGRASAQLLLFVGGWTLTTVAMMLPTS
ncbi:MAG: DUF2182 domain-containing protein, partial [Vicinamibacterales bacterium]